MNLHTRTLSIRSSFYIFSNSTTLGIRLHKHSLPSQVLSLFPHPIFFHSLASFLMIYKKNPHPSQQTSLTIADIQMSQSLSFLKSIHSNPSNLQYPLSFQNKPRYPLLPFPSTKPALPHKTCHTSLAETVSPQSPAPPIIPPDGCKPHLLRKSFQPNHSSSVRVLHILHLVAVSSSFWGFFFTLRGGIGCEASEL